MQSEKLNISVLQMTSVDDVSENLMTIQKLLSECPENTDLVCLPENALYLRISRDDDVSALTLTSPELVPLVDWCKSSQASILVGATPFLSEGKVYNSTLLIDRSGVSEVYRKIHLFDVDVAGEKSYRESDDYAYGNKPAIIEVNGWRIGLSVCYDLRFSELYYYYSFQEVDVVMVPAAFLRKTGEAHWEPLLRARAIEGQFYVVAAAQEGEHKGIQGKVRRTYGHSLIIDPWGQIIKEKSLGIGVIHATLIKEEVRNVRKQIPMKKHRRKDLIQVLIQED